MKTNATQTTRGALVETPTEPPTADTIAEERALQTKLRTLEPLIQELGRNAAAGLGLCFLATLVAVVGNEVNPEHWAKMVGKGTAVLTGSAGALFYANTVWLMPSYFGAKNRLEQLQTLRAEAFRSAMRD